MIENNLKSNPSIVSAVVNLATETGHIVYRLISFFPSLNLLSSSSPLSLTLFSCYKLNLIWPRYDPDKTGPRDILALVEEV